MRHPFFDVPVPTVIGHRGSSGEAPENTIPAFSRALELGASILETDVHRTRDGAVVVYHDAFVDRTTDGSGRIADLDLEEVLALDAGFRFSPDGGRTHPFRGTGVRISTLAGIFEAFPGVRFNVELKENDPVLIEATLDELERADREDRTLLAAADDGTMAALRKRLRERELSPAVGASAGDVVAFVLARRDRTAPPAGPMALQIPPTFGGEPLVTAELVEFAHGHDLTVHVWTINDPAEMHSLLDLGVDGVMTDYPARLQQVLAERETRPTSGA
jgi:glycerophosphoryl diester phosphodiesterase